MELLRLLTFFITYFLWPKEIRIVYSAENRSASTEDKVKPPSSGSPAATSDTKKPTTLTSVELDIKNTKSKETFDCIKKDGFAKYTPKSGHGFSSVKTKIGSGCSSCCGSYVTIWESKEPTDLATAVVRDGTGTCSTMNNVTIFFGINHRHFTKSEKMFVRDSDISLYGNEAPDDSNKLAVTQYTQDHSDDIFRFKFNNDTKCGEVKFIHRSLELLNSSKVVVKDESVWKHDQSKHGDQYPKELKYYWPDKIVINFEHTFIVHTKNAEAKWDAGHLFDFKLYVKDSNNLKELDATAYELTQDNEEYLFTFKEEVKLEEIKHKGKELWKHDPDKHGDKHPKFLSYATDKLALSYDDSFVVYTKDGQGKLSKEHLFEFKLYTNGSENNLKEMGVTAYDIEDTNNDHVIKFKDEHKCVMVKHKSHELWKHDPDKHKNQYPLVLRYKNDGSKLLIDADRFFVLCNREGDNLKAYEFFDLDISSYKTEHHYLYDSNIYANTFTLKKGMLCGLIKYGSKKIYKPFFPHELVSKVVLHKTVDCQIIYGEVFFKNLKVKRFYKLEGSDEWYIKLSPFYLDVKWKDDTCYYKYSFKNGTSTYTVKDDYGFSGVRHGNKEVWKSGSVNGYAFKVEMTETNKDAKLQIHLFGGETKVFDVTKSRDEIYLNASSSAKLPKDQSAKPPIPGTGQSKSQSGE